MKKIGLFFLAAVAAVLLVVTLNVLRHIVYWSPAAAVSFGSRDVRLAGTVVKPEDDGVFPGVVMLHGSGPEPRWDPTTRAVINALVRAGFAVLAYDKRGVGESGGDFDSAQYADFIDDAIAAVAYMAARPDVDADTIGLYAVSESGWLAPEIAARTGAQFVFNKVGSVLPVIDTVAWEVRNDSLAAGVPPADVQKIVDTTLRRWRYYLDVADDPELADAPERAAINAELVRLRRDVLHADAVLPERLAPYDAESSAEFSANFSYDPMPWLRELDIPLYYAYGSEDPNIPVDRCVEAIETLVAGGKDISFTVYPGLGHSLATWRGLLTMGFVPGYLDTVASWSARQAERR